MIKRIFTSFLSLLLVVAFGGSAYCQCTDGCCQNSIGRGEGKTRAAMGCHHDSRKTSEFETAPCCKGQCQYREGLVSDHENSRWKRLEPSVGQERRISTGDFQSVEITELIKGSLFARDLIGPTIFVLPGSYLSRAPPIGSLIS